jgi:polar amino acid transport system substrate-binding protein
VSLFSLPARIGSIVALCFAALAILALTTPAHGDEKSTGTNATLRVVAFEWAPFFFLDDRGELAGLEYAILSSFAEARSLSLEVVWAEDFDEVIQVMLSGEANIAASTLTITAERLKIMDFSGPYFPVQLVLIRQRGTVDDDLAGKKIVTIAGTTYEQYAQGLSDVEIIYLETEKEMFDAVASGRADALATDSSDFLLLGPSYPGLQIVKELSKKEFYGFALPLGDPLTGPLTTHIEELISGGAYWSFLEQAFGSIATGFSEEEKANFLAEVP